VVIAHESLKARVPAGALREADENADAEQIWIITRCRGG
jgi:hypothetical protein